LPAIEGINMNNKLQELLEQLIPYILLGIAIALIVGLFIMLSYVLIWGIVIGGVIWLVMAIKNLLFPTVKIDNKKGRVIEHDDE
jgi:hypothetical protein